MVICIKGMDCSLSYILQVIKPLMFKELAINAYDMELNIIVNANQGY